MKSWNQNSKGARGSRNPWPEVFDAVRNNDKLNRYFTTGGASAPLAGSTVVTWDLADFPGAFPVTVKALEENSRILLGWVAAGGGYDTEVEFRFEDQGVGASFVTVRESGWRDDWKGLDASYMNCQGWMQMLCCLKAWLEYGINLREGFFKAP